MKFCELLLTFTLASYVSVVSAAPEIKTVCHEKIVKGKATQVCKKVKIHKKIDNATKVPQKSK